MYGFGNHIVVFVPAVGDMVARLDYGAWAMTVLADLLNSIFERTYKRVSDAEMFDQRPLRELAQELVTTGSETRVLSLAREILSRYRLLDGGGKVRFFKDIAQQLNLDPNRVRETLFEYERSPSRRTYRAYADSAEPKRQEFIRRLNQMPGATERLVKMRSDLLTLGTQDPHIDALDLDFLHLFSSWFNRGFLVLRPINWQSPAHILEKIIAYEAVHAIQNWDDLRRRLEPTDRRCYAFFHPSMPDEPLIFVEIALTQGIPNSIQSVLSEDRTPLPPQEADTAVFYSISNCQSGLSGVSFGNFLIKQVAADLAVGMPNLSTFVTLSPIPGLSRWTEKNAMVPNDALSPSDVAAAYLLEAKNSAGHPLDPVARFHLGNGAIIHAIHEGADTSDKGLTQSYGTMVNYLYDFDIVEKQHEMFFNKRIISATSTVRAKADRVRKTITDERT